LFLREGVPPADFAAQTTPAQWDKSGAPGFQRRAVAVSLFRKTVPGHQNRQPAFFVIQQRGHEPGIRFQCLVDSVYFADGVVFHRPLVADVGK
jgi:hypothetical protein